MNENEHWLNRQLRIASEATEKWPDWMKREAGFTETPSKQYEAHKLTGVTPPSSSQVTTEPSQKEQVQL